LAEQHPGDPGVLVALLLNHVELQPGEALFLGAGNLHCYLEGVGVEVMANSDNVVRGGLTSKHIDVAELLEVVDPTPLVVSAQRPAGPVHTYDSPVPEFALTRVELAPDGVERPAGPRIVLVLEGRATLEAGGSMTELRRGHSAWIACEDGPVRLSGSGLAYEVSTGTG
jgi:mannose-6-phosphate isomerase